MQSLSVKENNIKINIKTIGEWEEWVYLLQNRDQNNRGVGRVGLFASE
jgi:hypothetical protein